tara:strand:+ start:4489 stop:5133 length:645 start_codon:yes stop_codon:yes gene_type:complete
MRYLMVIFFLVLAKGYGQDAVRFKDEITSINKKYDTLWDATKETILFTGSSSIRIWRDLELRFPGHQIVNSGFGGSQASDLLLHVDDLILRFSPKKVFIYEGDNDISAHKKPKDIIATTSEIIAKIWAKDPSVGIVLIAVKPSIARWQLKRKYKHLNRLFNRFSKKNAQIEFADVWKPMLTGRKVQQDIFIEDGLHMNAKGYEIWYQVLKPYME